MTDVNVNDSELIEKLLEKTPASYLKLPDRMNQSASLVKIWISIFGTRRKLKTVADEIRRSGGLDMLPRAMSRVLDPELIVACLLNTRQGRYSLFDEKLPFSYSTWVNLIFQVHQRVAKKLPVMADPLSALGFNLRDYDIQLDVEKSNDTRYLKALSYYVSENAYLELNSEDKDLSDFFVNAALCEIGDFSFMVDFLDKYPFLKNRNKLLYEGALKERDNELSEFGVESFSDFAADCAEKLNFLAEADSPDNLLNLISVAKLVDKIVNDPQFGLRNELTNRINHEKNTILTAVNSDLSKVSASPSLKGIPAWQECVSLIKNLQPDLKGSTLTPAIAEAIVSYCFRRDEYRKSTDGFINQFDEAYEYVKRCKAEVAEEALRDDSDSDSINQKVAKVKEVEEDLAVKNDQAGTASVELLKILSQLWSSLSQEDEQPLTLTHEPVAIEHDHFPTPQLLAPAADTAALDQLTEQNKRLLEKLESVNAHLAQMEELASNLEQENATVKRENHSLKQRVIYEPQKPLNVQPIDVTNATMIALVTQSRAPNPEEILRFYQSLAPDRLEVMECAYASASEAKDFHLPYRLSELLYKLIFEYLDLILAGNPDAEARKVFGKAYSAKESETVTSSKRLRAMREFYYGGETVLFLQHLGVGRAYGTQKSIRVYFKVIEGKIVIAHCGEHLETAQTN